MNNNQKKVNFNPNIITHQGYAEKQLLPKSLLKELIDEDTEHKINLGYLDNHMSHFNINERPQLPFHMTQPKRKVYSHQNVVEFNSPGMYNNFQMNQPNMYPNYMYNNYYNKPIVDNMYGVDMMGYSKIFLIRSIF
jgi:hypothetical protein